MRVVDLNEKILHCTFCGKEEDKVLQIVVGNYGACICDQCTREAESLLPAPPPAPSAPGSQPAYKGK